MKNPFSKIESQGELHQYEDILSYHSWRHRIPIAPGFVTPGYLTDDYWDECYFPERLDGQSVLDVGANDGLNAFRFERIGAGSVTAVDLYHEKRELSHTEGWNIEGCLLAKRHLRSNVDFQRMNAYDVEQLGKKFDIVLFADVMNWLTDIPRALTALSNVCTDTLIIRDGLMHKNERHPFLEYVHRPDYDLMYLPNKRFMQVILGQLGFKHVEIRRINAEQLLEDWVADYPLATTQEKVPVFLNPFSSTPISEVKLSNIQVLSVVEGRMMIRGTGWVNKTDAQVVGIEPRPLPRFLRKVLGDNTVTKIKRTLYPQRDAAYTIIARR